MRVPVLFFLLLSSISSPIAQVSSKRNENLYDGIVAKVQKLWNTTEEEKPQISPEENVWLLRAGEYAIGRSVASAALRNYELRYQKWRGWKKKYTDLSSVHFPGVKPKDYRAGDVLWATAWTVHSRRTQLPYRYSDLQFCPHTGFPEPNTILPEDTLGSKLWGVDNTVARFPFTVKKDQSCTPLCEVSMSPDQAAWLRKLVEQDYRAELTLDGLPLLQRYQQYAVSGYPVGFQWKWEPSQRGLNVSLSNHLRFIITFKESPNKDIRITGFDVVPVSKRHIKDPQNENVLLTCNPRGTSYVSNEKANYVTLPETSEGSFNVIYSYEVLWDRSNEPWEDRWDVYLLHQSRNQLVHASSLFNSVIIVSLMSLMVVSLFRRALGKELAKYKKMESKEDAEKASKWKLVHGDVFRPPSTDPLTLCVLVGSGTQIGAALFTFLLLNTMLHLWSPTEGTAAYTSLLYLYAIFGPVSGYVSARFYKLFGGIVWQYNAFVTAIALPGILMSAFLVANVVLAVAGASSSVGMGVIVQLLALWLCIHLPLVGFGSYWGFHSQTLTIPIEPTATARDIPEQQWYTKQPAFLLIGGLLSFGCVNVELSYAMIAVFSSQLYSPRGFVLLSLLLAFMTAAATSIVITFFQFSKENHRWWWNSFWNTAGAGLYMMLYTWSFCFNKMDMNGEISQFLTSIYVGMLSLCFALLCGSCGFLASFLFTCKLYGAYDASMESVGWYNRMDDGEMVTSKAVPEKSEESEKSDDSWEVVAKDQK